MTKQEFKSQRGLYRLICSQAWGRYIALGGGKFFEPDEAIAEYEVYRNALQKFADTVGCSAPVAVGILNLEYTIYRGLD